MNHFVVSFKSSLTTTRSRSLTVNQLTTFFSGIHQFSAEFSEILAKEEKGNLICSPISALITLAILDYGADGRTRQELETALNLPMNETYVKLLFHYFMRDLNDATNVELHLANALFLNNEFRINKMFRQISTIIFQPKIENLDFQNTVQSAGIINSWCKENTGGKISEIVEAGDLTEAQLVMVNAIYFKGQWKHRFTHHRKINFEISNTDNVPIEMMCNNAKYNNNQILNGAAYYIELPYETDQPETEFSMYVILPLKSNELDDIIDQVFKIKFVKLNSKESDIDFCMPKFRIESNLELIPVLKKADVHN
ncbi:hypothetical protein PV327_008880 [Microctonus hyperodae]|uniref:Serpin domain-containing protein n=1 Tax=Microctonus hyperodae TaxID=165561 RepID=A0AA39FTB6_MICHY|nr:hypothetical protein PV327_008880 [Microctonus hyperodae]